MKKLFYAVLASAAVVLSIESCQKNEIVPEYNLTEGLVFSSEKPDLIDETKTAWTGATIKWSKGDAIRVAYTCDDVWQNANGTATKDETSGSKTAKTYQSTSLSADAETAKFSVPGDFKGTAAGTYVFYGAYPASVCSDGTDFKYAPSLTVTIPESQTPAANSFDSAADFMLGTSVSTYTGIPKEAVSMNWDRMVAHAQLTFKTLNGFTAGETISQVELTADSEADMVGEHYIHLDTKNVTKPGNTVANAITINGTNLSVDETGTFVAWASFLPCTVKSLTVVVTTNKASYSREIATCALEFKKNACNTITINMSSAVRAKLESQPDYSGEWLIGGVNSTKYYVAKKFESGNNLKTIEISYSDSKVAYTDGIEDCKMVFKKVTEGTYAGKYTIEDANSSELSKSYLYAAGTGTNNYLKSSTSLSGDSYYWSITADENETFSIIASSSNRNDMRFNKDSKLFSCYASDSSFPKITLIPYSAVQADTRTYLSTPVVTAKLNTDNENVTNSIDVSWDAVKNADSYVVTATPSTGASVSKTVTTTPYTITGLAYETTYTISVVAKPSDTSRYLDSAAGEADPVTTGAEPAGGGEPTEQTIFLETFGSISSTPAFNTYTGYSATAEMFTTSENVNTHYSGEGKIGKNSLSSINLSSGYTDASGLSGCYHSGAKNTEATILQISDINITDCVNISVSFGALGGSNSHKVNVYYTIDGGAETALITNGSLTTANWTLLKANISGTGTSLTLIFKHKPTNAWTIRMDDIKVVGTK